MLNVQEIRRYYHTLRGVYYENLNYSGFKLRYSTIGTFHITDFKNLGNTMTSIKNSFHSKWYTYVNTNCKTCTNISHGTLGYVQARINGVNVEIYT